jgi:hypothetical protein
LLFKHAHATTRPDPHPADAKTITLKAQISRQTAQIRALLEFTEFNREKD